MPAVLGGDSEVLDLGRTRRDFSPAQRRALTARDRGCVAHHQWEWDDGGPTDLDNGAPAVPVPPPASPPETLEGHPAANGYIQPTPPASIDPDHRPRQHHRFRLTGRHRT